MVNRKSAKRTSQIVAGSAPKKKPRAVKPTLAAAKRPLPAAQAKAKDGPFPIVGIGASAGGLEAYTQLLTALPLNTGMGFVFIQHLDPAHESLLTKLLARVTSLPLQEVTDGMRVLPNHGYVMPPNTNLAISQGVLRLMPRPQGRTPHLPIDYFLQSLAQDQGSMAIGVILSGTASDGTRGLEAIKAEGGITFCQDEASAKYAGMPHSAISAGYIVDFILPPDKIATQLAHIGPHHYAALLKAPKTSEVFPEADSYLAKIFVMIRTATGVDFTHYKQPTIKRRILRRMVLHRIDKIENYVKYLHNSGPEIDALYQDLLINVTGFFRDPAVFDTLKNKVFPQLMQDRPNGLPIRIWVPGCATGEEAYSITMCLLEYLSDTAANNQIQVFGTDLNVMAIERARSGFYAEAATLNISPERLRRFFIKMEGGYQISKMVRDMCIFARQNVAKDPPFSKLDLISCRNVLIYFGPVLQKRVLPIFSYALKPGGFLVLGTSETVGPCADLFTVVDRKGKVYARKLNVPMPYFEPPEIHELDHGKETKGVKELMRSKGNLQAEADLILLAKYAPAGVLVNENLEILQFRGQTGPYLEPAAGAASLNLLKMAREGLRVELGSMLDKAKKANVAIRREGLGVVNEGKLRQVDIVVIPLPSAFVRAERYYLVLFEEAGVHAAPKHTSARVPKAGKLKVRPEVAQITQLRQELAVAKEYLQSINEMQEVINEELQSANQEIQSSNEELQSTNEELETSKEELQSSNEELITVNEELHNRNLELAQANDDLNNLLKNINVSVVILDTDLCIRRFNPLAEKLFNLIPTDIGRPLSDINPNIVVPGLESLIVQVIDSLVSKESEVQDRDGRWYALRIQPYKTLSNKIDGAVLTLTGLDTCK